jgi:hypothetical protein
MKHYTKLSPAKTQPPASFHPHTREVPAARWNARYGAPNRADTIAIHVIAGRRGLRVKLVR